MTIAGSETRAVSEVVEHLFRRESAKMVATLTRIFGLEHLSLAEDVVQEALARALQTWPYYGVPRNPAGWIMRASRNLALDAVRREKVFRGKEDEIVCAMERPDSDADSMGSAEDGFVDDGLRMMFVCSHPLIPPEAQVVLALKILCGFSPAEIAHAFLTTEAAIAKRLTRAKQKIREAQIRFEIPEAEALGQRLDGVLQSLYLVFNEGYKASSGERLVREEVCFEAIRLTRLLVQHPAGCQPKTHALLALMLFNAARLPTRLDFGGNLLRLQDQDRARWDQTMIAEGMFHLAKSAAGEEIGEYHLQAGINACHCTAPDYGSTDWHRILELYDQLTRFNDTPIVALNRAVALAEVYGAAVGIEAVEAIRNRQGLDGYYLFFAVLGEFEARLQHPGAAAAHFRKSLELAATKSEQSFLSRAVKIHEAMAE